jgi:hypothetical protein
MTKSKKNNTKAFAPSRVSGNAQALPQGSMARMLGAARVKATITESTVLTPSRVYVMAETNPTGQESMYVTGYFVNFSLASSLQEFYPSGLPEIYRNFDMFRIKMVEIYVSAATDFTAPAVPLNVCVLSSVDHDDALPTDYPVFRTRKNIACTMLTNTMPQSVVARFNPRANYAVSTLTSTPANVVPNPDLWYDVTATQQQFVGLKCHVATPNRYIDGFPFVNVWAKVTLQFKGQI